MFRGLSLDIVCPVTGFLDLNCRIYSILLDVYARLLYTSSGVVIREDKNDKYDYLFISTTVIKIHLFKIVDLLPTGLSMSFLKPMEFLEARSWGQGNAETTHHPHFLPSSALPPTLCTPLPSPKWCVLRWRRSIIVIITRSWEWRGKCGGGWGVPRPSCCRSTLTNSCLNSPYFICNLGLCESQGNSLLSYEGYREIFFIK